MGKVGATSALHTLPTAAAHCRAALAEDYLPRTFTFCLGVGRGREGRKMFTFPSVRNLKQTILALRKWDSGFTDVDFNG